MKKATYILAVALIAASCAKETEAPLSVASDEICFNAAEYIPSVKGALATSVSFGASATLVTGDHSYSYFDNAEIAYDGSAGVWKGVSKLAWPKGLADYGLDIQCYAPYSATPWCAVTDEGKLASNGSITVATINSSDPNYDLMYSDVAVGKTQTNSASGVPVSLNHALASVAVGVNIVRSNDAVILDAGGRYTYEEWVPGDPLYESTHLSYIVPIGKHPNDLEGIPCESSDPGAEPNEAGDGYHQHQQFGYRLKNSIQNVWIASLISCKFDDVAESGTLEMSLNSDKVHWDLPTNGVWTIPSDGEAGVDAHSTDVVIFEGLDIEIPPSMRSTTHIFPFDLRVIPQDLCWSPLTPSNNQKMHIRMKVRQFNYKDHAKNDRDDKMSDDTPTGDAEYFDYRDIYQYDVWDGTDGIHTKGEFKAWKTQKSTLAPGVEYVNMVWRETVADPANAGSTKVFTPTYEYIVDKEILLYDSNNFVSTAPQYWKMNTKTVYVTRINFAGHEMAFEPVVIPFTEEEITGGGSINN